MPPASMAKMMTVYVAFDLIKKGELKLDKMITVRPETWRQWHGPAAGSTMFLSPGEQVSVQNLLRGIVTLSGNDACVVLAEGIAGTEPAFAALMNQQRQGDRPDELALRQLERLARRRRHLRHRARSCDAGRARRSAIIPSSTRRSTASRSSPGARRWARAPTSPSRTAIRCSAASPAPTGSRPAIPRRPATASPDRPSRAGGGW